eukprot:532795_1
MDGLHQYLLHLFDLGLRTQKYDIDKEHNSIGRTTDSKLSRRQQIIGDKDKKFENVFEGFKANSDKYTMKMKTLSAENVMFLDELFEFLESGSCSTQSIYTFYELVNDNEYDTDAIVEDVVYGNGSSNVLYCTHDDELYNTIQQYIEDTKLSASYFSIGIVWFYWPFFENKTSLPLHFLTETSELSQQHSNDFKGYTISDLYVKQKYSSYKLEILKHISIKMFNQKVLKKASGYMKTKRVKLMKVDWWRGGFKYFKQYQIHSDQTITVHHIISIIMYCDFSEYCSEFSSTFRKKDPFEPLHSVKYRNQSFWWQSKLLREAVELYGKSNFNSRILEQSESNIQMWEQIRLKDVQLNRIYQDSEFGPFYSGINCILFIPGFRIYLGSPTSTSKHMEVSLNFATRDGMIIQLNNIGQAYEVPFFDCSWISKYVEEAERLFIGGWKMITIESVIVIESKKNFEEWFQALGFLDELFSGIPLGVNEESV